MGIWSTVIPLRLKYSCMYTPTGAPPRHKATMSSGFHSSDCFTTFEASCQEISRIRSGDAYKNLVGVLVITVASCSACSEAICVSIFYSSRKPDQTPHPLVSSYPSRIICHSFAAQFRSSSISRAASDWKITYYVPLLIVGFLWVSRSWTAPEKQPRSCL